MWSPLKIAESDDVGTEEVNKESIKEKMQEKWWIWWFDFLFNDISTFKGYLMPKLSL